MIENMLNITGGVVGGGLLLLAGLTLGTVYFGGLWITLRHCRRWQRPFLGMAVSWIGRLVILLGGGAWLLKQSVAPPLLVILLISMGFWLSRMLLITRLLVSVER